MEIKVPLSHFTDYLAQVKAQSRPWVHLNEPTWLVTNFSFDNDTATYHPEPELPFTISPADGPFTSWWKALARN